MADSKKYDGSQWEHSLRKLTTATEAVENPLYSDGTAITSYTIKGNTVQDGTPTPSNPVSVTGVGDKTANLFSYADTWSGTYQDVVYTPIDSSSFRVNGHATGGKQITQALDMTGTYRLTITIEGTENDSASHSVNAYVDGSRYILIFSKTTTTSTITFTGHLTAIDTIINNAFDGNIVIKLMLTEGTSQVDYEPYGYKIPIPNGQQTTNIYLGSTQTTRQIIKINLKSLNWTYVVGSNYAVFSAPYGHADLSESVAPLCNKFRGVQVNAFSVMENYDIRVYQPSTQRIAIRYDDAEGDTTALYSILDDVYLYAVLTTPETAAVNEPLMKLGTYADTLSNATPIPTTEGANSITVDTTVQPSEFTATWTGWHDSSVKEYDGTNWQ